MGLICSVSCFCFGLTEGLFLESPIHLQRTVVENFFIHLQDCLLSFLVGFVLNERIAFCERGAAVHVEVHVLNLPEFPECIFDIILLSFLMEIGDDKYPSLHGCMRTNEHLAGLGSMLAMIDSCLLQISQMLSMAATELEFYQKKIHRLEVELLVSQDEIQRLRAKLTGLEDSQIKYELLLEKMDSEAHLRRSRRTEELTDMQEVVATLNAQWELKIKETCGPLQLQIDTLRNTNSKQREELLQKSKKGDEELLSYNYEAAKKENEKMRAEMEETKRRCEMRIKETKEQWEMKLQAQQENERQFYRTQVEQLNQQIEQLNTLLEEQRVKTSPAREQEIKKLNSQINSSLLSNAEELNRVTQVLQAKNNEIQASTAQWNRKNVYEKALRREAEQQVHQLEIKVTEILKTREHDLLQLRRELSNVRENQAEEMKRQIDQLQREFQAERERWGGIIASLQEESNRCKQLWEQDRQKFIEEKAELKKKIEGLQKPKDEQKLSQDILKSMKELQAQQEHFSNYENSITFLDRHIRKTRMKLELKNEEVTQLLREMNDLRSETQAQIALIKLNARTETKKANERAFELEAEVQRLSESMREKQRESGKREKESLEERQNLQRDNLTLHKIIQEMQIDYNRLTQNKKSLENSYREERDNVITGKVDINEEKKRKWMELDRQRYEQEILFRQQQKALTAKFQIEENKLNQLNDALRIENATLRNTVAELTQRLQEAGDPSKGREQRMVQYQKKLAAIDLEISLTQNLFDCLASAKFRSTPLERHIKTELEEISEHNSGRLSSDPSFYENLRSGEQSPEFAGGNMHRLKDSQIRFSFLP